MIINHTGLGPKKVSDFNDETKSSGLFSKYNVSWDSGTANAPNSSSVDIALLFTWNWVNAYAIQIMPQRNQILKSLHFLLHQFYH